MKSIVTLILLVLSACAVYAQTAQINGVITDPTEAVVPGAKVTVVNMQTGITRRTTSNDSGNYTVPLLPPGTYQITVQREGLMPIDRRGINVAVDQVMRIDFVLQVGDVTSSVDVSAEAPLLDQGTSSLGQVVGAKSVQDLPLSGRNFVRLAQLTAGANEGAPQALASGTRPDDRRRTAAVSVNGQRDFVNNFLIDGMDNNERSVGTVVIKPSMDALAEFRVQTNLYAAEFGRTAGGVINLVTKSGTNTTHGSLFEFLRNDKVDARHYFALPGDKPPFRQNQFGGSLGGPIRNNRSFYFVDYEGFRQRQAQVVVSTVPSEQMRRGNFSGLNAIFDPLTTRANPARPGSMRDRFPADTVPASRVDPVSAKLITLYPLPLRPDIANNFTHTPMRKQREDVFDIRADHMFSEGRFAYLRYSFNDNDTFTPPQLPPVGEIQAGGDAGAHSGPSEQRSQSFHMNYVHAFRPNVFLELKGAYSRFGLHAYPVNRGRNVSEEFGIGGANAGDLAYGLSTIAVAGFRGLGDNNFIPLYNVNNLFQYVGSLTWIRASHNVKAGADLRRRQVSYYHSPQPRGSFTFNANFTNDPSGAVARSGNSVASLLLGYPSNTTRNLFLVWPGYRTTEVGAYIQDDWRVNRWLTLNLGVRYDVFTPFTEVADRIGNVDLPAGRIILAGKDGVSRSAGVRTDWSNLAPRFGFAARLSGKAVLRGGYGISYYPGTYGVSAFLRSPPFTSLYTVAPTQLNPINRISEGLPPAAPTSPLAPQGSLSPVSTDTRSSYVQQYNLTLQAEALPGTVWRGSYVGGLGRAQAHTHDINLAPPGAGAIGPRRPYSAAFPNVAAMSLFQTTGISNYHALQTSLERRLRAGLDLTANYTYARLIDDNNILNGGKPGSSGPQLSDARWLERGNADLDLRHRLTLLASYELPFGKSTGRARALTSGWLVNAIAVFQGGLPFTINNGASRANTGGSDRPNRVSDGALPQDQRTLSRWFDTSAFVVQPLYTIGSSGRNILYAPGQRTVDFSVLKEFPLTEKSRLQFRGEVFNVTNTPNFGNPQGALGTPAFGTIASMTATPRQMQFGLKLLF